MKPVHFDLADSETRIRANFSNGLQQAAEVARTDGDRELVELQGRFIDTIVLPIIETMRRRNEERDVTVVVEALASTCANALINIGRTGRLPLTGVFDAFALKLGDCVGELAEARSRGGESDTGVYRAVKPSYSEGGNA